MFQHLFRFQATGHWVHHVLMLSGYQNEFHGPFHFRERFLSVWSNWTLLEVPKHLRLVIIQHEI